MNNPTAYILNLIDQGYSVTTDNTHPDTIDQPRSSVSELEYYIIMLNEQIKRLQEMIKCNDKKEGGGVGTGSPGSLCCLGLGGLHTPIREGFGTPSKDDFTSIKDDFTFVKGGILYFKSTKEGLSEYDKVYGNLPFHEYCKLK